MPRNSLPVLVLLLLGARAPQDPPAVRPVAIKLSVEGRRLNPATPMLVRFTLENLGDRAADLDEPADWLDGLELKDVTGKIIKASGSSKEKKRSISVDARGFFGRSIDIRPALGRDKYEEGFFEVTWRYQGLTSNTLSVLVMRDYVATIETTLGDIKIEFFPEVAPKHVQNFLDLARHKYYEGTKFHRVIAGFMMQGGEGKRTNYSVEAEFNDRKHVFGTVSMARGADPNSASTQFFICFDELKDLDGKYTVFGQVIEGAGVVRDAQSVTTDHSPCARCGKELPPKPTPCCGDHHSDLPKVDIVIKKVTIGERK